MVKGAGRIDAGLSGQDVVFLKGSSGLSIYKFMDVPTAWGTALKHYGWTVYNRYGKNRVAIGRLKA